ncbi:3-hydroxyacyl-CoA dehydrogenase NAD-binding domain-containing protein [Tuberibacillus sp. Marseille-P3662]|uniref:3-hydroxyacyl-CoA dehydrogenase NAD-binding domain-containing protein n=1 Tax=Tuberibacillus sp. Marseille-P3662 TaxID=1965358 RepID=UPI000A1CBC8B|nr:3-hydroxyacyl-CoA dehydrogenase NAD-binding domain-containing protein [Tuberibacillus sp. Marseille-P3662]
MIESVAVIGAGNMGRSIAQFLLQNNVNVLLIDENDNVARHAEVSIKNQLEKLHEKNCLDEMSAYDLSNLEIGYGLPARLTADLVIEAIPEKLAWKQNLFLKLEDLCSTDTLFATNTSGLSISEIALNLDYPERLIGTHFFTPAAIIPLVEVVKGRETSDATAGYIVDYLNELGKKPVLLQKEVPGFIGNRIQHAIAREAISLLESGVASAEDIDTVVKWSIGLRMVLTGPIEQRDINGLDIHYDIASYLYKDLSHSAAPSPLLKEKVDQGETGLKAGKGFYDWETKDDRNDVKNKDEQLIELIQTIGQNKETGGPLG